MPTDPELRSKPQLSTRHGYFVLQASAQQHGSSAELTGVIENLSTGRKQPFGSAEEITHLMMACASEGLESEQNRRRDDEAR